MEFLLLKYLKNNYYEQDIYNTIIDALWAQYESGAMSRNCFYIWGL